eukprot:410086-Amphidinium_carterae.1
MVAFESRNSRQMIKTDPTLQVPIAYNDIFRYSSHNLRLSSVVYGALGARMHFGARGSSEDQGCGVAID